jgi:hypothetical protein
MTDLFFSKDRILKSGPLRGVYSITFALFFILTELGRKIYRPYVYQNSIKVAGLQM